MLGMSCSTTCTGNRSMTPNLQCFQTCNKIKLRASKQDYNMGPVRIR